MPRPKVDSEQVTFRLPRETLNEVTQVATMMSRPGFQVSRTDAIRAALAIGLKALRDEHLAASKKK